jgi:hypothetical protein
MGAPPVFVPSDCDPGAGCDQALLKETVTTSMEVIANVRIIFFIVLGIEVGLKITY